MTNNWIQSQQNGALINLDNLADIIVKEVKGDFQVLGYTVSGFGVLIFKGTEIECLKAKSQLQTHLAPPTGIMFKV